MNKSKKNEIKVGIVAVIGILVLILGITLGKGLNVSVSKQTVKFKFNNSGGITDGSPVVVNGVRRGMVTSIANHDGAVMISADLDFIDDLKSDATARITILEITGGKKIEINPGKASSNFDINKEIPGYATSDIADLVAQVGEVSTDLIKLVKNLDTLTTEANSIMADKKFAANLKNSVQNLSDVSTKLNTFLTDNYSTLQTTVKDIKVLMADLKSAVKKYDPELEKLLSKLDVTLQNVDILLANSNSTIIRAEDLVKDVNSVVLDVKNGNGLASRIIYDKNFASQLDSTLQQLSILVNTINNHGVNVNVRLGTRP